MEVVLSKSPDFDKIIEEENERALPLAEGVYEELNGVLDGEFGMHLPSTLTGILVDACCVSRRPFIALLESLCICPTRLILRLIPCLAADGALEEDSEFNH